MKSRLLWHSNSPTAPTGYGVQTALFAPLLNRDYDVAISTFYGLEGAPVMWNGIPLLPGLGGNFGAEFMPMHAARWGQGDPRNVLTVSLMDVWVLPGSLTEGPTGLNLACWTPVDHDPAPPGVKRFFAESDAVPIAMSRFGQEALSTYGALYCPHGVDTQVYAPISKKEARAKTGVPEDIFLVGWVGANKGRPSRKGFAQGLTAFAEFRRRHENAFLYLHTSVKSEWMQGEDLFTLIEDLGIPEDSIKWAEQYNLHFAPLSSAEMRYYYASMDVLLNPTTGGGFEICQLEAAACGVPCITTNTTAMPESAGPTPWLVDGFPFWTGQNSWNYLAYPNMILDALEECYAMPSKQRRALAKRVRRHAEKYDVERVYREHMLPAIKKAEKRILRQGKTIDITAGLKEKLVDRKLKDPEEGPSISVVTPWQDHPELANDYIKAVLGENVHEVIIVDNGSDPPVEGFAGWRGSKILHLDENVGFCPANNIGLEAATGDAVLFLNNDVALGVPGWLEAIRAELAPGVLVGANVRMDDHTIVDGQPIAYLDGWCIAGMKEDFEKLGGWDETYLEPAYYSDNDLCFRARQAGMRFTAVNPPLIHLLNRTAGPPVGHVTQVTQANYQLFSQRVRDAQKVAA